GGEVMKRSLAVFSFVVGLALIAAPCVFSQQLNIFAVGGGTEQRMEVRNGSGFYCEIVAANSMIATLAPGERIIDERKFAGARQEMPVWAVCYHDKQLSRYVGFTGAIFHLLYMQPSSNQWTVRNDMLRGPDGAMIDASNAPSAIPVAVPHKVKIPGKNLTNETFLNIFNNSKYAVLIEVEGRSEGILPPGKLYLSLMTGGYYPKPFHITVTAVDSSTALPAKNMGAWTTQVVPQSSSSSMNVDSRMFWVETKDFK
ncbi:MAG: hypothetical protein P4L67_01920, partial [Candidatus Pacebacteria bacterium]|nr:hypothetical protein [Candidatus Paceibacterota bacterium]